MGCLPVVGLNGLDLLGRAKRDGGHETVGGKSDYSGMVIAIDSKSPHSQSKTGRRLWSGRHVGEGSWDRVLLFGNRRDALAARLNRD